MSIHDERLDRRVNLDNPFFVGFDGLFKEFFQANEGGYPPHNLLRDSSDPDATSFIIELAVAGFKESDLKLELNRGLLTVSGTKEDTREFIHKGIATRKFTKQFRLAEHVEVNGARLRDGILYIYLKKHVPDDLKPKIITIETPKLLVE